VGPALALLEGGSLLVGVSGALLLWGAAGPGGAAGSGVGPALALAVCYLATSYLNDVYDVGTVRTFRDFAPRLLESVGLALIPVAVLYLVFPDAGFTGQPFAECLALVVGLVVVLRAASYGVLRSGSLGERVLIVGAGPLAERLIRQIEARRDGRYAVVGVADDDGGAGSIPPGYPWLGPLKRLDQIVEQVRPHRILVALTERRGRLPLRELLASRVLGVAVEDGVEACERLTGKVAIESLTPGALTFSRDFRKSGLQLALGRAVSFTVALGGLVALAPLFGLLGLAIRLDSPGPVFFLHDRVGLNGRPFQLIKFRTMRPTDRPTSEWVRDNGDRITRVGRWLRRFRLDELPQFLNVLRGDMNLVGPRPHPVSNLALFRARIPFYALRSTVRPGVTGWAQVRYGYANDLEEETEKMRYDLYYIKHLSPWLDLRILVRTARMVLFGRDG
jgi:exopolysaccharide biosynthesis polyprenyl glycosylphosphotransferase